MEFIIIITITIIVSLIIQYLTSDTVKDEKSISKKTGIKSLGNIPFNNNNKSLLIENNPKANIMKYIRDVRKNIIESISGKVMLITSCDAGEGKSWVSNNLAVSLARINKKVLLIDANLRKESNKSEIFYIEKGEGVSDFVKSIELDDKINNLYKAKRYIKKTQIPNLYLLPNGTLTDNAEEIINSKKMGELINILKEIFDYIILDGTAFFDNEDCINLLKLSDFNILVVENNKTKNKDIKELIEELEINNDKISGFILNKSNIKHGKYYAKNNANKFGFYMETRNEEIQKEEDIECIIDALIEKNKIDESSNFKQLSTELKDDILIEDFINDVEVNFNMKIDNIEKKTKNEIEALMEKLEKNEENMQTEIARYNYKRSEDIRNYENFSKNVLEEIKSIRDEISSLKVQQKQDQEQLYKQFLDEIQSKNIEQQIQEIKQQIEENKNEEQKNIEDNGHPNMPENKKNNIINLGKMFLENRRKNNRVFSIDQPISYEDLERLAIEVINFDSIEDEMYTKKEM